MEERFHEFRDVRDGKSQEIVRDQFLAIGNNSGGWTALSKTAETWKVDKQGIDGGKRFALPYAITTTPDGAAAGGGGG